MDSNPLIALLNDVFGAPDTMETDDPKTLNEPTHSPFGLMQKLAHERRLNGALTIPLGHGITFVSESTAPAVFDGPNIYGEEHGRQDD